MSVSHASLSGASVHESKGIETASAGQVYVANGSGSGAWTATTSLSTPFTAAFFHAYHNTAQTLANDAFTTLFLNTEVVDDLSITVSSGNIPLAAGTYYIKASLPVIGKGMGQIGFYNNSDSTFSVMGSHVQTDNSDEASVIGASILLCEGRFTIAATKTYSLRARRLGDVRMKAAESGFTSVFTQLYLWKLV